MCFHLYGRHLHVRCLILIGRHHLRKVGGLSLTPFIIRMIHTNLKINKVSCQGQKWSYISLEKRSKKLLKHTKLQEPYWKRKRVIQKRINLYLSMQKQVKLRIDCIKNQIIICWWNMILMETGRHFFSNIIRMKNKTINIQEISHQKKLNWWGGRINLVIMCTLLRHWGQTWVVHWISTQGLEVTSLLKISLVVLWRADCQGRLYKLLT